MGTCFCGAKPCASKSCQKRSSSGEPTPAAYASSQGPASGASLRSRGAGIGAEPGRGEPCDDRRLAVGILGVDEHVRVRLGLADLADLGHERRDLRVLLAQGAIRNIEERGERPPAARLLAALARLAPRLALETREPAGDLLGLERLALALLVVGHGAELAEAAMEVAKGADALPALVVILLALAERALEPIGDHRERRAARGDRRDAPLEKRDEREHLIVGARPPRAPEFGRDQLEEPFVERSDGGLLRGRDGDRPRLDVTLREERLARPRVADVALEAPHDVGLIAAPPSRASAPMAPSARRPSARGPRPSRARG